MLQCRKKGRESIGNGQQSKGLWRRWLYGFCLCCCSVGLVPQALAQQAALTLGIMPFNSTLALIKIHEPLVRYLEQRLQRKLVVHTSPDYFVFANDLLAGKFDLAIAGPHFSSMAHEQGYTLLYRYSADLQPVLIVRSDSAIQRAEDLKGKTIGLSSRLSMSSIGGIKWLHDQGLHQERDYTLKERDTHGAVIAAVAVGQLDAALTTHTPLKQVPEDVRARIRILPLEMHMPHLMTLVADRLGSNEIEQVRAALHDFPATPAGKAFFQETGYLGYTRITPADLTTLKPYVRLTTQLLRQGK